MTTIRNKYEKNLSLNKNDRRTTLTILATLSIVTIMIVGSLFTGAFLTDSTDPIKNIFLKATRYTLEYHDNVPNEEIVVPEQQVSYNEGKFTISSDKPLRDGFVFTSWNTKADGNGETVNPNTTYTTINRHTDLYAQWETGYTLIYDANGGKNAPEAQTAVSSEATHIFNSIAPKGEMTGPTHKDPNDPKKQSDSNRVFLGWSTDKNATEPEYSSDGKYAYLGDDFDGNNTADINSAITIDSSTTPSKTITLYAVWATKYELRFSYHPDMTKPKTGDSSKLQAPMTFVSSKKKAHTFTLITQAEADAQGYTPTREESYRWGWWGDNLERFKFKDPAAGQTAVQAGNEGCYQFGEPVPARTTGDTSKVPNYDEPVLTLYAYFQPPSGVSIIFDNNTSNTRQFPEYSDRNNTYKVDKMPDNKRASFTQIDWRTNIPDGENNTPIHPRYHFLGWSEDKDKYQTYNEDDSTTYPEYQPGDQIYINKVLNNEVTLYAIWEPMHNFRLTFDRGYKNSSGRVDYTGTNEYYVQTATRQWKKGGYNIWFDSNTTEYEVATSKYFTDDTYTWEEGFFTKRGFFATKDNDSVGTYKFLGWSWEPQEPSTDEQALMETVAFPVTIPDDPNSILNTSPSDDNTIGVIKEAITVSEVTKCTKPTTHGYASNDKNGYTLYAVYRRSPLHQLRVVFNKGQASDVQWTGEMIDNNNYGHYIVINGVSQTKDNYYASLDHEEYTWDASYWATNTPKAIKNADTNGTATYTFLGWSTDPSHATPSTTITKDDIDYPVDDNGHITKSITAKESADEAKNCPGGNGSSHTVTLYPVFRKNLFHVYKLNYDVNIPSKLDGIVTTLYIDGDVKQVYPDPNDMDPLPIPMPEVAKEVDALYTDTFELGTEKSHTWDLSGKVLYATCINQGSTVTGEMTLIGWATKKYKLGKFDLNAEEVTSGKVKFYPISVPSSGDGKFSANTTITIDVDEKEPRPSDACTDTLGRTHEVTLYAVWVGEPVHQYSIVFAGNGEDTTIKYGKKEDFANGSTSSASETFSKEYKVDNVTIPNKYYDGSQEIALSQDIKNTYRVFSEAFTLPDDPNKTDTYQFKPTFWNDNSDPQNVKDLIVKAERKATGNTRYVFDGWNTKDDGTGTDITVDNDGYITSPIEIKDTDYEHCDSYTHNIILYAKWKPVSIHNFQLILSSEGANSFGSAIYSSNIKDYLVDSNKETYLPSNYFYGRLIDSNKLDTTKTSFTWGNGQDAAAITQVVRKNSDTNYRYEFIGWSKDKKEPSTSYTSADAEYHVDSNGVIQEPITILEPDSNCEKQTHVMVLYPVFKKIPIHNFSITLNVNGGSGLRAYRESDYTWYNSYTYTYNYPNSNGTKVDVTENSHSWTVADFWSKQGFSAFRNQDNNYTYEFVGWSTEAVAASENPDMTKAISWSENSKTPSTSSSHPNEYVNGFINQDITANCEADPCEGGDHNIPLYAIWKRSPRSKTYTLKFDANGGENAPADITKVETYNGSAWKGSSDFTITNQQIIDSGMKNKGKVFVGWHEDANSDSGRYGQPNSTNQELELITQDLKETYTLQGSAYSNEKTLYAIWWFEFNLDYNANGGSNAPEHEHAYVKGSNFEFEISKDIPSHSEGYTFLGWSETQIEPGQGTIDDVQLYPSTSEKKVDWNVTAAGSPEDDNYGNTSKTLYAVWGPASTGGN